MNSLEHLELNPPPLSEYPGLTLDLYREFVNRAYTHYTTNNGNKPTPLQLYPNVPACRALLEKVMPTKEWAISMAARGIEWNSHDGLSSEQAYALALLTDPTERGGLKQRLDKLGLSYTTYRAWLNNPVFSRAVSVLSERMLSDSLGSAHGALVRQVEKGDVNAIKFYYEITGRFDPKKQQVMDVMSLMAQVIEIIQKHVTDPNMLNAIGGEFALLAAVAVPGSIGSSTTVIRSEDALYT
jgi:Helix-turn-helix of insertion element transposase